MAPTSRLTGRFARRFANPENDVLRNAAVGGHRSAFSVYPVFAGPLVRRPDEQRRAGLDGRLVLCRIQIFNSTSR